MAHTVFNQWKFIDIHFKKKKKANTNNKLKRGEKNLAIAQCLSIYL